MKYRRFGRTELQMPVFSCGGMRYQFKWQDVPPGEIPPDNQRNLEALSIACTLDKLIKQRGYPEEILKLEYDPTFAVRGLVVDRKHGNILKMRPSRPTLAKRAMDLSS